jgi:hypothetical protein
MQAHQTGHAATSLQEEATSDYELPIQVKGERRDIGIPTEQRYEGIVYGPVAVQANQPEARDAPHIPHRSAGHDLAVAQRDHRLDPTSILDQWRKRGVHRLSGDWRGQQQDQTAQHQTGDCPPAKMTVRFAHAALHADTGSRLNGPPGGNNELDDPTAPAVQTPKC